MEEDFLVTAEFPKPITYSVKPSNNKTYFPQDQYKLYFMYRGLRLITVLDAGR